MQKIPRTVRRALREAGAVLLRENKHLVFKFPNNKRISISHTPSDDHAVNQMLRDIERSR